MIRALSLSAIASQLEAKQSIKDASFDKVCIDSRRLSAGDLFVALIGEQHDGHDYIEEVSKKAACGVLLQKPVVTELPYLLVEDTKVTLGRLAKINRENFQGKVVAVTGSSGKTSVKEMIASILKRNHEVVVTSKNQNNEIGVPLTLLDLETKHEFAVVELGARKAGDIQYLVSFVKPFVAVLTNAGAAHLEGFGSIENIVKTKGEIIDGVPSSGYVVLNFDDPHFSEWKSRAGTKNVLAFSLENKEADVYASDIQTSESGNCTFTLHYSRQQKVIQLNVPGRHNVANALAAAAACICLDIPLQDVVQGLAQFNSVAGRLRISKLAGNVTLIDDTYNANPASVKAAIDSLVEAKNTKFFIFGDMGELGETAKALHEEVGHYAKQSGIAKLFTVGDLAQYTAMSFGHTAKHFASKEALIDAVQQDLRSQIANNKSVTVLIKASRFMKFETIVDRLQEQMPC